MPPSVGYYSRFGIRYVQPRAVEQLKQWAVVICCSFIAASLQIFKSLSRRTYFEVVLPACVAAASQGFPEILQGLAVGLQGLTVLQRRRVHIRLARTYAKIRDLPPLTVVVNFCVESHFEVDHAQVLHLYLDRSEKLPSRRYNQYIWMVYVDSLDI